MPPGLAKTTDGRPQEFITFALGDALYGLELLRVEEISRLLETTKVPKAPAYVVGILNLRGKIVTVIDLGKKIGLSPCRLTPASRNIIINFRQEYLGLLVEGIAEVITVAGDQVSPTPPHLNEVPGKFLQGVVQLEAGVIAILDIKEVLRSEDIPAFQVETH